MGGTKIKICGIRRAEDCDFLNEAMPEYAGFIFWDRSFRYVSPETAQALRRQIDGRIGTVGVFVDAEAEAIAELVRSGTIGAVQLHGHEDEAYIGRLRELLPEHTPVWKAFKVRSAADLEAALHSSADMVLLDNGYGTGECFDHSLLRRGQRRSESVGADGTKKASDEPGVETGEASKKQGVETGEASNMQGVESVAAGNDSGGFGRRYILAGGLTPENIPDLIRKYAPFMVDISSGVETDRKKDRDKILRAVAAAHGTD